MATCSRGRNQSASLTHLIRSAFAASQNSARRLLGTRRNGGENYYFFAHKTYVAPIVLLELHSDFADVEKVSLGHRKSGLRRSITSYAPSRNRRLH
jgi:hypothetical protein